MATSLTGDQSDGQVVGKFVRRAMMENRFIYKLKKYKKQRMAIKRRNPPSNSSDDVRRRIVKRGVAADLRAAGSVVPSH